MQWNPRIAGTALVLVLSPFSLAMSAQAPELFKPMPLATLQSAEDATLRAIHAVPAYHMINRVTADASALREQTLDMGLTLAPEVRSIVHRTHAQTLPDGSVIWRGTWHGAQPNLVTGPIERNWLDAANEVTLVNRNGLITGSVRVNGDLYAIRPLASGGHAVIAVDERHMPAELAPRVADDTLRAQSSPTHDAVSADGIDARVMIVFSDNAIKSLADPTGLAHLAVAETNDGYARSGVAHRLQMVDAVYASEYRESGSLATDLGRLASTQDGFIDWIHARRDEQRADLVTLITAGGDACGMGYLNADASSAFTVATKDCATGYYSYGHELGHNYGASHDPAAGRNPVYAYGHGFQNVGARLRTIMAYECSSGCHRVNLWSGPDQRWDGRLMGNAHESHNARVLNERAGTVANFR